MASNFPDQQPIGRIVGRRTEPPLGVPLESPQRQPRVLVVDDERVVLLTVADDLRRAGYEVSEAQSGEQALESIQKNRPDIALLDMRMPGMSGIELAKHLREETGIPFLFLSAFEDKDIVRLAAENGALGYLVKPVFPHQIAPAIETALARAKEIRDLRKQETKLREVLNAEQQVSMAAGVLMERHRVGRQEAFQILRNYARNRRQKLDDVAEKVLDAAELLNTLGKKEVPREGN